MTGRRLVIVLFALFGFIAVLPAQTVAEQYLLAAANQDRAAHGLAPLHTEEHLILAARLHAFEMSKRGSISHQFPGEAGLAQRTGDAGAHFSLVTENVAEAPNAGAIHDLWMNSAGHRANLLDPAVDAVGIAVVATHGQFYAVEDFARTVRALSIDEQEQAVAALVKHGGMTVSDPSPDARQTCTMSTGYAGERQPWFVMRYTSSDIGILPDELKARMASGKYTHATIGACTTGKQQPFTAYSLAVLLYP